MVNYLISYLVPGLHYMEFIEAAYKLIPGQSDTAGIHRLWTERGSSFKRQLLKDKTQFMFSKETIHLSGLISSICQTKAQSVLNASHVLWISNVF